MKKQDKVKYTKNMHQAHHIFYQLFVFKTAKNITQFVFEIKTRIHKRGQKPGMLSSSILLSG